jgi:phage terminase Nu1 subunit (DNA packaging protein)
VTTNATVTTAELARLFDVTPKTIAMLGSKGIIVSAGRRGSSSPTASGLG